MATIGLRVDVDTFRGTRDGVPALLRILSEFSIKASFFFSVGPDNMGRHLLRLAHPAFLWKMARSKAASLYGWDIVFRGLLWPGAFIGGKLGGVIKSAFEGGHEIGLHAWDHHAWQSRIEKMDKTLIECSLARGVDVLSGLIGCAPSCSAAPGWKCTADALEAKARFPFSYNSDCRGHSVFRPVVRGKAMSQPQVPATLPTYDEVIGRDGVDEENYNSNLLGMVRADCLNVLTIHAEVEGIARAGMFRDFMNRARSECHEFVALGSFVSGGQAIPEGVMAKGQVRGREGWLSVQAPNP